MAQSEVECDSQQYFLVWRGFPLSEYGPIEGKRIIYSQRDRFFLIRVLWWILRSDALVIHGLFNTKIIIVLLAWFTRTKITWVIWGRDLDRGRFAFVNWLRGFAMRRVDAIVTLDEKDRDRFIQLTGREDVPSLPGVYSNPISLHKAETVRRQPSTTKRILIGNSSSPSMNHIFVFEKLAHLAGPNVQFWVPLGYGDLAYKKTVLQEGRRLLGDSFFPLESSLNLDDYIQVLANMDAAIFYMPHQQALSNIFGLVAIGRKVFLHPSSGLISTFKNKWNVELDDFELFLKAPSLDNLLRVNPETIDSNRIQVRPAYERDRHLQLWRQILKEAPCQGKIATVPRLMKHVDLRKNMRICVVCQAYPNPNRPDAMAFTHARNLIYKQQGHSVTILNFSTSESYNWDGFSVLCESDLSKSQIEEFDLFVFHAPNLRNHLRFILKYRDHIRAKVIIGHGHEFINAATQSGRPFPFQMTAKMRAKLVLLHAYDIFKMRIWAWYFKSQKDTGLAIVFVSEWLRKNVEQCLNLNLGSLLNVSVINNPIHPAFQDSIFEPNSPKVADFITLRSFDTSKYGVDIVAEVARRNPQFSFHIYGNGDYFKYNPPPPNLTVIKKKFCQPDLPALFNQYRAGLLPTRWDSQGVLMCEMACMGMPVVVSDLPICKLMVGEFENVAYIDNENPELKGVPDATLQQFELKHKFGPERTVQKELELFSKVAQEGRVDRAFPGTILLASLLRCAKRLALWDRPTPIR